MPPLLLRLFVVVLLLGLPGLVQAEEEDEELVPTFPTPEPELTPTFPAAEGELTPTFPAPETELTPTFPAPETELTPTFPAPETELTPTFPAPETELTPTFPAPETGFGGDGELVPTFPSPEGGLPPGTLGDDDDSAAGGATPLPTPTPPPTPKRKPRLAPELVDVFLTTEELADRIEQAESQITVLAFEKLRAVSDARKAEIDEEMTAIKADAATLRASFRRLAGGVDTETLEEGPEESVSFEDELADLLAPVVTELKRATERPRETERLRIRLAHFSEKSVEVDDAIDTVQQLLKESRNELHRSELQTLLDELTESRTALRQEREVAQGALHALEIETGGVFSALGSVFQVFFAGRARNILAAFVTFVLVGFLLYMLRRFVFRTLQVESGRRTTLWFRVLDLTAVVGTALAAALAGIAVLFVSGDWVLLTVASLILFGFFWGARQSIPQFWSEVRLLLNVGSVREGERVVYEDLPWLVESLQFVSILRNPAFPGVHIRLPLSALEELVSRPFREDEPWFPTAVGDFVDLGDDGWGAITFQSPEVVQARVNGVLRTYSATDWYGEPPTNLSTGWRSDVLLTLDYSHQDQITTSIPELLEAFLEEKYKAFPLHKHMQKLTVGFEQMADSSLDLEISAWFDGSGAALWESAEEDLAALCVDACNEYGWTIAFPQVALSNRK